MLYSKFCSEISRGKWKKSLKKGVLLPFLAPFLLRENCVTIRSETESMQMCGSRILKKEAALGPVSEKVVKMVKNLNGQIQIS